MLGKVIKSLLDANTSLNALVPVNSRFPYVLNENTPLPAIVYTVDSLDPEYNKDGWCGDNCAFSVVTFSDNYATLQDISFEVRAALELMRGTVEGIGINRIYLKGQSEGFNITESVFLNKLTFEVKITNF
jgi:hypothetical protein